MKQPRRAARGAADFDEVSRSPSGLVLTCEKFTSIRAVLLTARGGFASRFPRDLFNNTSHGTRAKVRAFSHWSVISGGRL